MADKKKAKSKLKRILKKTKLGAKFVAESVRDFPENFEKQGGLKELIPTKKNVTAVAKLVKEATSENVDALVKKLKGKKKTKVAKK